MSLPQTSGAYGLGPGEGEALWFSGALGLDGGQATAEEHAEAGDQGRGLAAAGRGNDEGRPIGERRGRALLRVERRE